MEMRSLIKALGGAPLVAARLGRSRQAVVNAARRGKFPSTWNLALWQMALDADVAWSPPGAADLRDKLLAAPGASGPVSSSHPDTTTGTTP